MDRWLFAWRRLRRRMWFRASLYALVGVFAALAAVTGAPWVPETVAERLGGESVEEILTILASSLLAVATFSLGAMVTAYTAVSSSVTPRAASLVTSDEGTQKALATFVGAFLYAIVAVTAINAEYYGPGGRAIIFLVSLGVVALVAFRLLAWIGRLSDLARMGHMIGVIEHAGARALNDRLRRPHLGGVAGDLETGLDIASPRTGYVQNVDPDILEDVAEAAACRVQVLAPPGAFVRRGAPLARLENETCEDGLRRRLVSAFAIGDSRSFDQDPRHALVVLGEIAARALSPGVNDPGTAIQVIGSAVRLLDDWARPREPVEAEPACDRILAPGLDAVDLLDDILGPVSRHGASDVAVMVRLRKALAALGGSSADIARASNDMDALVMKRSRKAIALPEDFDLVAKAV